MTSLLPARLTVNTKEDKQDIARVVGSHGEMLRHGEAAWAPSKFFFYPSRGGENTGNVQSVMGFSPLSAWLVEFKGAPHSPVYSFA